ncbi:MAG: AbrB family transcriptional regulator [Paracoccaceae bacterium]
MTPLRIGKTEISLPHFLLAHLIGAAGGFAARALHLPLPMLLGSLLAVGAVAVAGLKPLGRPVHAPPLLRLFFIPVIGLAIGGTFTPEVLNEAPQWIPSLLALCLFLPIAHAMGYAIFRHAGGLDPATAWFGSVPGGLIESVLMGEEAGADSRMLTMLQFLRLILTIIVVPLAFTLLSGHAVGSAGGASLGGRAPLGIADVALLAAAGVSGFFIARWLRLPAYAITGPIVMSSLAHLFGLTQAVPPAWMVTATQLVVGTSLGARFAGLPRGAFSTALRLAFLNMLSALALALAFAFALHGLVGERAGAVFLAFAPGGLIEMGLIALSMKISVIYVTGHHVARILLSVTLARALWPRIRRTAANDDARP